MFVVLYFGKFLHFLTVCMANYGFTFTRKYK